MRRNWKGLAVGLGIWILGGVSAGSALAGDDDADSKAGFDPRVGVLSEAVEILTAEVARLREAANLPGGMPSAGKALAPGVAKVYSTQSGSGVSLGGYGEVYLTAPTDDDGGPRTADFHRFITYVGYKFTDRILMNTELEYEHATTSANAAGKSGSVSVEFSYLDFRIGSGATVRTGNLLVPMGFVNRMHEPPFYRGNVRPTVERTIIPSTWRELGAGIHGEPAEGLRYELYAVNGLNAKKFDKKGVRGARQKGNRALFEDTAVVASVDFDGASGVSVGGSVFHGGSGQGQSFDGQSIDGDLTIAEVHAEARRGIVRARALAAGSWIGDAAVIGTDVEATVPERQQGGYAELAVDVAPALGLPRDQALLAWARWEEWDLQREVPAGMTRDPAQDGRNVVVGVEYFPHAEVVLKLDWTHEENEAGTVTDNPLRVGAGFVF